MTSAYNNTIYDYTETVINGHVYFQTVYILYINEGIINNIYLYDRDTYQP